ncbi:hypothetical protein ACQKFL_02375 [Vreelandella titanicae]|uniref:hypothetical protein n=1 Tax=Vreelandella titanicae TaxID=664683 RepID=UPI003D02521F
MQETLADIEALTLRCRSDQSKSYIAEANQCYRAGAYRAAIVSTWVAVVFDLIDKIRDLSVSGDANAIALEHKLTTYIGQINSGNQQGTSKALEFERNILATCRDKLQFFDQQQFVDLERLREDRHRCAHPSFQQVGVPYRPSAEQARLHIRNAVVHVLSQPPVQGRAALAGIKTTIASQYFPASVDKAVAELRKAGLVSPTDALVRSVLDALVFGFLTPDDELYEKDQAVTALNALHEISPGLVEERLGLQLSKAINDVGDDRFLSVFYLVASVTRAWDLIDQPSKARIERFVEVAPYDDLSPAIGALADIDELRPELQTRIRGFNLDELARVVEFPQVHDACKGRAFELLAESGSWDRTNAVITRVILPLFEALTAEDVTTIVRLPKERRADLLGAHAYKLFVDRVRDAELMEGAELDDLLTNNGAEYLVAQA